MESCDEVNILNEAFVTAYIKEHKAAHSVNMIGIIKCEQVSKDLRRMFRENILQRCTLPFYDMPRGYPKWIYCYSKINAKKA